jgi:Phage ABA sandwich domain
MENNLELKAGKELDVEVATKVMGWHVDLENVPDFSTSIEYAWMVVYKSNLLAQGYLFKEENEWCITVKDKIYKAKTAPLVICKAALEIRA